MKHRGGPAYRLSNNCDEISKPLAVLKSKGLPEQQAPACEEEGVAASSNDVGDWIHRHISRDFSVSPDWSQGLLLIPLSIENGTMTEFMTELSIPMTKT